MANKPIYPRMLYPNGDTTGEPIIVQGKEEEAAAEKDGYAIGGSKEAKKPKAK